MEKAFVFVVFSVLANWLTKGFVANSKIVEETIKIVVWAITLSTKKLAIIAIKAPIANQKTRKPTVPISIIKKIPEKISQSFHISNHLTFISFKKYAFTFLLYYIFKKKERVFDNIFKKNVVLGKFLKYFVPIYKRHFLWYDKTIISKKEEPMKKKKSKKFLIRRFLAVVVVVSLFLAIRKGSYIISERKQSKQVRLLFNHEIRQLEKPIYIENSVTYFSEEDVKQLWDETIYYNVGDQELITTSNKQVAVLHLNQNQMMVNDVASQMQGQLKEIEGQIYLPISDLGMVYDSEIEYIEATNLVIVNATTKAKKQAMVLKDTKIKASKIPFSLTKEKVKRGDTLVIIEESGCFQKVRTSLGTIGYVKTKKLSDIEVIREEFSEETNEIHVLEGYSDLSQTDNIPAIQPEKDNFVLISDFTLAKEGKIVGQVETSSESYKNYANWAETNDIGVVANLKNDTIISNCLATYEQRNQVIQELYNQVMQKRYKGICMDFEKIDDVNSFYRFLIELVPKFRDSGLKVMVKLNQQMNVEKVKNMVDFTISSNER